MFLFPTRQRGPERPPPDSQGSGPASFLLCILDTARRCFFPSTSLLPADSESVLPLPPYACVLRRLFSLKLSTSSPLVAVQPPSPFLRIPPIEEKFQRLDFPDGFFLRRGRPLEGHPTFPFKGRGDPPSVAWHHCLIQTPPKKIASRTPLSGTPPFLLSRFASSVQGVVGASPSRYFLLPSLRLRTS